MSTQHSEANEETKVETTAAAPEAPAAPTAASDDGDDDGDGEDASEGADGADGEASATAGEGGEKKKRRRRRKKKKPVDGAVAADGAPAEGAAVEGAAGEAKKDGKRPEKKHDRKPKEERERPPFAIGDIVFGKVLEVTDDVLFVDLSGKAKGVFDLRELLIPEDEKVDAATAAAEEAAEEAAEATTPAVAEASAEAAPADAAPAEAVAGEASESVQTAPAPEAKAEKAPPPQLPRVILEPGAQFVGVVHNDGARGGLVVLTHHPHRLSKAKPGVAQAAKDGTLIQGIVTGVIKGGVEVDVDGLRAFTPASHMDLRLGADLSRFVGQRLSFTVTQYGKRGRDVVLSRRSQLEVDAKANREAALAKLEVGSVIEGTVRTVVSFGAFVDLGGVEGLVPLSEMSHNRADGPHDVFKVGEATKVKLLRIDEKGKLWLSRKATIEDPWAHVAAKYAVGTKHTGKIVRLQPFGAFVELESGVDGLVHTGDLSSKRIEHPKDVVSEGDSIDVVVSSLDAGTRKIGLHPALTGEFADEVPQRVQKDKILKVVVLSAEAVGLQVRIKGVTGRSARGFIPAGGTNTARGTDLRKEFPPGRELDAKVLEIDPRRGEVKLSIRALHEENERSAFQAYRAQVKREAKFGTFGDLLAAAKKK